MAMSRHQHDMTSDVKRDFNPKQSNVISLIKDTDNTQICIQNAVDSNQFTYGQIITKTCITTNIYHLDINTYIYIKSMSRNIPQIVVYTNDGIDK